MNDRIELLREMLLQPLQGAMDATAAAALGAIQGGFAERALESRRQAPDVFSYGAWCGYKLAFGIFERWLAMTGKCSTGGRFAVHSNPADGLRDGPIRALSTDASGRLIVEKEDGGSCNG